MAEESTSSGVRELGERLQGAVESASAAAIEKVTRPILTLLRWTILAALVASLLAFVLAAVVIGLVRVFDANVFAHQVWATDFVVAGIFCGSGGLFWVLSAKKKRGESAE